MNQAIASVNPIAGARPDRTDPLPPLTIRSWPRPVGFLFWLWAVVAAAFLTSVGAILCTIHMIVGDAQSGAWWWERFWSQCLHASLGIKVEVVFEAPLPEGEPVVFVSNHQGNFDITSMFIGLGRRFVFAAKKSVFAYPFLGWHIGFAGFIPIDRTNREAAVKSLENAANIIRSGTSVTFYAEGTRSKDGSILPFKKGPFMYALKSGVPVVPVAIEGSLQVNPKRTWYVCPNTIRILVGPPIPTTGLTTKEQRDELIRRTRSEVIRLHRRLGGLGGDESNHIAASGFEGIGHALGEELS